MEMRTGDGGEVEGVPAAVAREELISRITKVNQAIDQQMLLIPLSANVSQIPTSVGQLLVGGTAG